MKLLHVKKIPVIKKWREEGGEGCLEMQSVLQKLISEIKLTLSINDSLTLVLGTTSRFNLASTILAPTSDR